MWTYRNPYRRLNTTVDRIEYWAKEELYRALNIRHLVGFVGSGVTLAYGRLTWGEFARLIVMGVGERYHKANETTREEAKPLYDSLCDIIGLEAEKRRTPEAFEMSLTLKAANFKPDGSVLELCAELAKALDEPDFVKNETKRLMIASSLLRFELRLILLEGKKRNNSLYQRWRRALVSKKFMNVKGRFDGKDRRSAAGLGSDHLDIDRLSKILIGDGTSDLEKRIRWDNLPLFVVQQAVEAICDKGLKHFQEVGIWEFLRSRRSSHSSFLIAFLILAGRLEEIVRKLPSVGTWKEVKGDIHRKDAKWPHPIRTIVETLGIRRILTLNYDLEIEEYFTTERNFRGCEYLSQKGSASKSTPNSYEYPYHVGYDGYGKRFFSVSSSGNNVGELIDFSALAGHQDSYVFHLHGRADKADDLIITEYDYQQRYVSRAKGRRSFDEAMRTLFSGNDILFMGVGMSEADLMRPMRQFVSDGQRFMEYQDGVVAFLNKKGSDKEKDEVKETIKLKTEYGIKTLRYTVITEEADTNSSLALMLHNREQNLEQSQALVKELEKLAQRQQTWLSDWKAVPDDRLGTINDWSKSEAGDTENSSSDKACPIWVRQRVFEDDGKEELYGNSYDGRLLSKLLEKKKGDDLKKFVGNPSTEGRRIVRLTGRRGCGKGQYIDALKKGFKKFLPSPGKTNHPVYDGAFFVDAQRSMEFTSVISSLTRFIAGRVAALLNKTERDIAWSEEQAFEDAVRPLLGKSFEGQGRLALLRAYIQKYSELALKRDQASQHRLFICFSGLDILVDKDGYGYNALHRAFFRELTGSYKPNLEKDTARLDIVLIAGNPDKPIRYLSAYKQKYIRQKKGQPRDLVLKKAPLKPWYLLPEFPFASKASFFKSAVETLEETVEETPDASPKKEKWLEQNYPNLYKVLKASVFLRFVVNALFSCNEAVWTEENQDNPPTDKQLKDLDFIANRDGDLGVIEYVLSRYYNFDLTEHSAGLANLMALVLKRLTLFSSPIERSVIARFPLVEADCREEMGNTAATEAEVADWLYANVLRKLAARKLIIPIYGGRLGTGVGSDQGDTQNTNGTEQEIHKRYVLHGRLRKYLAKRMRLGTFDKGEHSFFDVSLYATQPQDLPSPSLLDYQEIGQVLQNIVDKTRQFHAPLLKLAEEKGTLTGEEESRVPDYIGEVLETVQKMDSIHSISRDLRAGLNLLSGSFSLGVLSRLSIEDENFQMVGESNKPYENYRSWTRSLLNASVGLDKTEDALRECLLSQEAGILEAKLVDDIQRCQTKKDQMKEEQAKLALTKLKAAKAFYDNHKKRQRPFYKTQIVWLYNERALASFLQGHIYDAVALFDIAYERAQSIRWCRPNLGEDYRGQATLRRVTLNRAIARLEAGKIEDSLYTLSNLCDTLENGPAGHGTNTYPLARGYLGLCYHLNGRYKLAKNNYKGALDILQKQPKHVRAVAIIRAHLANLYRTLEQHDDALRTADLAISAASSSEQFDVLNHAYVSLASVLANPGGNQDISRAMKLLDRAETFGSKMGVYKLLVDVHTTRGQILLRQNQLMSAGQNLTKAIAYSNKFGMKLRKISALSCYAELLAKRGDDDKLLKKVWAVTRMQTEATGYLHQAESLDRQSGQSAID